MLVPNIKSWIHTYNCRKEHKDPENQKEKNINCYLFILSMYLFPWKNAEQRKNMLQVQNKWDLNITGWRVYGTTNSTSNRMLKGHKQSCLSFHKIAKGIICAYCLVPETSCAHLIINLLQGHCLSMYHSIVQNIVSVRGFTPNERTGWS